MTSLTIVCDNCGAKYKLPEAYDKAQAKCTKCGSAIAVDAQRGGAVAAPGARPAAARPAVDRSRQAPPPAERPALATRTATERPRRARTERDAKPARSPLPWILGGVVLACAIAFLLLRK